MHLKCYRVSLVSHETLFYSVVSNLSYGSNPPRFLTPNQLSAFVKDYTEEEIRRATKLTPAIQVGFEACHFEVQILFRANVLQVLSIFLGTPVNSQSSTVDIYRAISFPQYNHDETTASLYIFIKKLFSIATDNSHYADLSGAELSLRSRTNWIRIFR